MRVRVFEITNAGTRTGGNIRELDALVADASYRRRLSSLLIRGETAFAAIAGKKLALEYVPPGVVA